MSERKTATIEITVAGETRTVEFSYWTYQDGHESAGTTGPIFTGHIGRGSKTHQVSASLHAMGRDEARGMGYSRQTYRQASDGRWYGIRLGGNALNRQVRITGWADTQPHTSRHIMERATEWQKNA